MYSNTVVNTLHMKTSTDDGFTVPKPSTFTSKYTNVLMISWFNPVDLLFVVDISCNADEKGVIKKRGRKRKIRSEDEMIQHFKEKKEKNRLAAKRLRQRMSKELASLAAELKQLEVNVKEKKKFAEMVETKLTDLREKLWDKVSELNIPVLYNLCKIHNVQIIITARKINISPEPS